MTAVIDEHVPGFDVTVHQALLVGGVRAEAIWPATSTGTTLGWSRLAASLDSRIRLPRNFRSEA